MHPITAPILVLVLVCLWTWVCATDRTFWALGSLPVVVFMLGLVWFRRRLPLSVASYASIVLFFCLHEVGQSYTYDLVPAGFWAAQAAGLQRNPYDRLVHFALGALMARPVVEASMLLGLRGRFLQPFLWTMAFSAIYEIAEGPALPGTVARYFGPDVDPWDAQNDMATAGLGSLFGTLLAWLRPPQNRQRPQTEKGPEDGARGQDSEQRGGGRNN